MLFGWLQYAGAIPATTDFLLDNGLKLIVQADHRAPVAVVQVWYRVGGSYELDGATGVSHAVEHMMFKRTKRLATGEFSRVVADHGGRENAFTTPDYTTYFQQWSADNVELSFELEAERMHNLVLDPAEFANELKVIREERRLRTDDNAHALAFETVLANTWQTSPYRQPVIGWAADIDQMALEDLSAWYHRYYAPNNAIVVVVGDVEPKTVLALAAKHFGPLAARQIPTLKDRPEIVQRGEKRLTFASDKLKIPKLILNYKVPGLAQRGRGIPPVEGWEISALEVLAATLDGGASARFERNLVRGRELALGAGASYQGLSRLEDLFTLEGEPREGVTLEALEVAIKAEIKAIKMTPPANDEFARIKIAAVAEAIYQQDSMFGQAMIIGSLAVIGMDWRLKDQHVDNIRAVTSEQVQAVARKYLNDERATVAYLVPAKTP
ncbi:MAG: insulinase family protein [Gammaproteobacteria bacterium]|nr:insulinase family protein [Gammaproteobacteria bacterium]